MLAAAMTELATGFCPKPLDNLHQSGKTGNLFITSDTDISWTDHAVLHHGSCFEKDKTCATEGTSTIVDKMKVSNTGVFFYGVHTHR